MMKNFRSRAQKLREKMSNCAFDQGNGPSAEDLLTDALEATYNEGRNDVLNSVQIILDGANQKKQEKKDAESSENKDAHIQC